MRDVLLLLGRTKEGWLGRTKKDARQDRWKVIATQRLLSLKAEKVFQQHRIGDERSKQNTFQILSLKSVIKYTKSLLLSGFSEK